MLQMGEKNTPEKWNDQRKREIDLFDCDIFPSIQFELLSIIYRILTEFKGYKSYKSRG